MKGGNMHLVIRHSPRSYTEDRYSVEQTAKTLELAEEKKKALELLDDSDEDSKNTYHIILMPLVLTKAMETE
mgnify:CR=1 FL=1|tara:strand:+ start:408 stop:623 length:216 start_codon:yes stop_codon:yes gene_type:complete